MLTLMTKEKGIMITQDLSIDNPPPVIKADSVFMYSKQDINITAVMRFEKETYTCTHDENSETFSFIQSQAQSNDQTNITEDVLKQNYINQFNIKKTVNNLTMWELRNGLKLNFTYTIIALNNLTLNSSSKITTSRVGIYSRNTMIKGTIEVSG